MGYISDGFGTQETIGGITLFESMRSNQLATPNYAGLMSPQDKAKLDGIEENANKCTCTIPDEIKAFIEKFKDSIPFTQEDKDKLDASGTNPESCLLALTEDGNIVLKPFGSQDEDEDDNVIAVAGDIAQLIAKFTSPDKDEYDDVIATDSDTQQLINKFA